MILKGDFVDVTAVLIDKYFSGKNQIGVLVYIGGFEIGRASCRERV